MKNSVFLALLSLGLSVAAAGQWKPAESAGTRSYAKARQVLLAAAEAHGGLDALRSLKTQYRAGRGKTYSQGQNLSPDSPAIVRDVEVETWQDFAGNRVRLENRTQIGGAPVRARNVAAGDTGYTWNAATQAAVRATPGQIAGLRNSLRRDPLRLLVNALDRSETVRSLGADTFDGRAHDVVSMTEPDGSGLTLYFDAATHLLSKVETWADTPVFGDTLAEQIFSDYRAAGGVKTPFRLTVRNAGEVTQEINYSAVRINEPFQAGVFDVPKDLLDPPGGPPIQVTLLAPGSHFIGGGSHNSLAVVFRDYVVVVEGPLSSDRSRAVLARVKELAPDKPVRYVVNTHYHYDHSGGLREYMAEGTTVVTHSANADFVRRMAKVPRSIRADGLALKAVEPKVEAVSDKRVFTDGEQTLELYAVPSSHANGMLVGYLPKQKVLFNSDLFSPPPVGPLAPANDFAVELRDAIRKLGLQVETFAGGHGRVGPSSELEKAVALRK